MIETNEISASAKGGTELMMERLYALFDDELLNKFQIIPSRVRELNKDKIKILYCHDLPGDPESAHLANGGWKKFDKLVFVSNWQQQMYNIYFQIPYSHSVVIPNAITPFSKSDILQQDFEGNSISVEKKKIHLFYTSTPHRGLNILVPVFEELAKEFDDIHLDVFSSYKLYGWNDRDEQYKDLFVDIDNHPNMTNHGTVSNDEIRKYLVETGDIFAYPSTWQETSCLCLIEALCAGKYCVHSNLAALPETSGGTTVMYNYQEDPQTHAEYFYSSLKGTIETFRKSGRLVQETNSEDYHICSTNNKKYGIDLFKLRWNFVLTSLLT